MLCYHTKFVLVAMITKWLLLVTFPLGNILFSVFINKMTFGFIFFYCFYFYLIFFLILFEKKKKSTNIIAPLPC